MDSGFSEWFSGFQFEFLDFNWISADSVRHDGPLAVGLGRTLLARLRQLSVLAS